MAPVTQPASVPESSPPLLDVEPELLPLPLPDPEEASAPESLPPELDPELLPLLDDDPPSGPPPPLDDPLGETHVPAVQVSPELHAEPLQHASSEAPHAVES